MDIYLKHRLSNEKRTDIDEMTDLIAGEIFYHVDIDYQKDLILKIIDKLKILRNNHLEDLKNKLAIASKEFL